jgi:two-component system, NarL family, nitrate/nitrite response regulator NarL
MINIVLADERLLFVDLLTDVLLGQGYVVVDTATTRDRAVAAVGRTQPDLCLVDHVALGGSDALTFIDELRGVGNGRTKVVAVTGHVGAFVPDKALVRGVAGYVHKECAMSTLFDALDRVVRGEIVVEAASPEPSRRSRETDEVHRLAQALTPREWECLELLVEGMTTVDMARTLSISVMTVRSHIRSLLTKLSVHSRLEVASLAMRHDLLGRRAA